MSADSATVGPGPQGWLSSIGHTPLLRLERLSAITGCEVLAKAEFMNPGGSIKDRTALGLVLDAEARGALRPGGTIVEGSAGNTGLGLALVGQARGYRCRVFVCQGLSPAKVDFMRAAGAEVEEVEDVPAGDPGHYACRARDWAAAHPGAWWADQFDNLANQQSHYNSTGAEILAQCGGRLDAFVASVGTGGSLAGISRRLKEARPGVRVVCADPEGAAMAHWFSSGVARRTAGESALEGVGQTRATANVRQAQVDAALVLADRLVVAALHHLLREEGLFVGPTAALNVAAAVAEAWRGGPGRRIVTLLCDGAGRYAQRFFHERWLSERGLAPPPAGDRGWLEELRGLRQWPAATGSVGGGGAVPE